MIQAQIKAPRLSPASSLKQTIGLTEIEIDYSRPSKNKRTIFGELVPYDKVWRTGANENTVVKTNEPVIFGKDTLKPGAYSLYTKPTESTWTVIFYSTTDNWGNPQKWEEENIVLSLTAPVKKQTTVTENFEITFDNISTTGANLVMKWDQVMVAVPFEVTTNAQMAEVIETTMAGPSRSDYYAAADYYISNDKDPKQALEWMSKAIEMTKEGNPFWMHRKKSVLQAKLGDYKGAIASAKLSIEGAKLRGYDNYVQANEKSIKEWEAKK